MSDDRPKPRRRWSRPPDDGPRATVRQLLPYVAEHKPVLSFVVLLSLVGAAASLGQPLLVAQVIGAVQGGQAYGRLVAGLVMLVVVAGLISGYQHYLLQRTGEGVVLSSRRRLVGRMLRLPIAEFDRRRTGDLVSRVGSDTTLLRAVLTQGLVEAVGGAVTFVGAIIAMAVIDPVLLLLTVLVVAVAVSTVASLSERIRTASREAQRKVGDLAAAVERALGGVRTIRAANATEREVAAIDAEAEGAWRMGIRVARISALIVPIAGVAMQVSFLIVLGVGGFRVASGAITVAQLIAFILFLFLMIMPLGQAFGAVTSVNQALGALGRIQEIVGLPTETEDDERIAADAVPRQPSSAAVEFANVTFRYPPPPDEEPSADGVLHGVSFRVERGRRTALVGPSGAGKSTVLALIERFYDPDSGVVRVDGHDVRSLRRENLRASIGYVEQDAPVLAGTIRQNLLIGTPNASDAECLQVLTDVNLLEVLNRSPRGLHAQVGEDGVMLSGGERQRLAIARALLAAPPILLLDESTSSLDGLNEQLLREAIDAVAEQRTLIVIAHRLSTVVDSDTIVVLDHGRVVGVGTHSELTASTPLYRELARHQLLV